MTYYYDEEDLPEVVKNEDGTYTVEGKVFFDKSINTEENIQAEIDRRIALLHYVQAENDAEAAEEASSHYGLLDELIGAAYDFAAKALGLLPKI